MKAARPTNPEAPPPSLTKRQEVAEHLERTQKALKAIGKPKTARQREQAALITKELNRLLALRDKLQARPPIPTVIQSSLFI
jgi:hypothetical protein